jgi:hypothetical protein
VSGRQCVGEFLVSQQHPLDRGIVERDPPIANIDGPFLQRGDLLEGGELEQNELDTRANRAAEPHQLGQPAVERRGNKADPQTRLLGLAQALRDRPHFLDTLEHLHGLIVDQAARAREAQRTASALDQCYAALELLDLPAQWRLGNMQHLSRAGEVPLARHRCEVSELAQLHLIPGRY